MLKPALLLLSTLFAGHTLADTVQSCPSPSEIQNTHGVLTAKTESGTGQWLGVTSDPTATLTAFDSAIFYADDDKVEGIGRLKACTYMTATQQAVDLRYRPEIRPDVAIRLAYTPAWQQQEGPFGIVYFECRQKDLQGCAFKEVK